MEQQQLATAAPPEQPAAKKKIRSICIDTVTTIMKNQVYDTWQNSSMKHEDWKD